MQGWVSLHREIFDWQWFSSHKHFRLFIVILLRANHKKTKWRNETINEGQLLTGRKQLSVWSGISESHIRRILIDLESSNELTIKRTNKYSIISIVNWDKYQNTQKNDQQMNQQMNQQKDTSNNVNNVNNVNNTFVVSQLSDLETKIFHTWNKAAAYYGFTPIKKINLKRKKHLRAAFKDFPNFEDWRKIISAVRLNPYNLGKNEGGWIANFDWLFRNNNLMKLYETEDRNFKPLKEENGN